MGDKIGERYGKIINNKLILAPQIITREGALFINEDSIYIENGYKKISYVMPPENKEGYNLVSEWEELPNKIIQKWTYKTIDDDYSGELLVAVRSFDSSIKYLKYNLRENYDANKKHTTDLLKKHKLINLILKFKDKNITVKLMLQQLHLFKLDLNQFFDWLKLREILEKNDFIVRQDFLIYISEELKDIDIKSLYELELEDIYNKEMGKNIIFPMYIKSNLSKLFSYDKCKTSENRIMYNMSFIYLFTLFDELLLKIIRIICLHEKKWLISNEELTSKEILKCNTTEEVHMMLVEKKITKLSWENYLDKIRFLEKRGIKIKKEYEQLFFEKILYLSTKRNILVHNEGVWSQSSKKDLIETNYYDKIVVGESIDRNYEDFQEACEDIELAIKYLYERLCNKFQFLYKYDFIKSV